MSDAVSDAEAREVGRTATCLCKKEGATCLPVLPPGRTLFNRRQKICDRMVCEMPAPTLLLRGPAPQLKLLAGSRTAKLEHLDLRCLTECLPPAHVLGAPPMERHAAPVIGNETLTAIATNFPRLRSLRLQDVKHDNVACPALAVSQGLQEIAKRLTSLETLRLDLETSAAKDVAAIVKSNSRLKDLHSNVSSPGVSRTFSFGLRQAQRLTDVLFALCLSCRAACSQASWQMINSS